ncbi:MAG: DNA mismatch repair protein MutS [Planctomycetes bacterium]|nr:DNA mismatch repair protein MutS [Planctomycetota bacterium]
MSKQKKTPMMEQYHAIKSQHTDKILFFRMGDFYEMFFEDAKIVSRELGLTLTSRDKGENPVPMAGAPHHQGDRYIKELIEKGYKVAVCDQLEDPAQAQGIVKRGVTRVVTPGTVLEDNCLKSHSNNFLAAVTSDGSKAGLAYVDISTGEFFVSYLDFETLGDELERLAPSETLVPAAQALPDKPLAKALRFRAVGVLTERDDYHFDPGHSERVIKEHFGVQNLSGFGIEDAPHATGAAGAVLEYINETQKTSLAHIRRLRLINRGEHLILDRTTQRNLELTHPLMSGGKSATLLSVIDRTKTGPGGRLIKSWLLRPLTNLEIILSRQDGIRDFMEDHILRAELREHLAGIADMERIMARVITNRANPRDLAALAASIGRLPGISALAESLRAPILQNLVAQVDTLDDLGDLISECLVDEPPVQIKDGGIIRDGYHPELDELRSIASGGKDWLANFQKAEQERTGIPSLKIGFNKVFGYYIEITKAHKDKAPAEYDRKQTLVNAERFITPQLKEYESKVLGAEERISRIEYELFSELREKVALNVERVQTVARALAELDVLASLAEVGATNKYIIPEVHEGIHTEFIAGRHPVLETMIPDGEFISNDTIFDPETCRLMIITGPNMAGKSTYIRQVALLTILAQMGAPVPAEKAMVGVADRIFTRVGAADDLSRGQSTFMVEMSETANILNNATERSLVILDEVGRGTSTFDGVSLAWSITEFLHHDLKARTLFATHYHELAELGVILDRAENFNVAVRDWGGEVIFLHKIQPGSCDRSYGIQVGRLAGIPQPVIERAQEMLNGFEAQAAERDYNYINNADALRAAARDVQMDLFAPKQYQLEEIGKELQGLELDNMTPVQAHEFLRNLAEKANR